MSVPSLGFVSFLIKRLLLLLPILLGVTVLAFVISHLIMADPARVWAGLKASPSTIEAVRLRYHLNDPIWEQYWYYLLQLVHFNFGTSPVDGTSVLSNILTYLPNTIELAIVSILIDAIVGIPLGVFAASHWRKKGDKAVRALSLVGSSTPPFLAGLVLLLIMFYYLGLFPSGGQLSPLVNMPPRVTGMVILDSLIAHQWTTFLNALWHISLPAISLSIITFGLIARVMRASMLDVLQQDFIRTARSKGINERIVVYVHALRNALIPTVTVLGLLLGDLLSGTIVVESIFSWPGIGRYAVESIVNSDFPSIMGVTIVFTLAVVLSNLVADVAYAVIDPRVSME